MYLGCGALFSNVLPSTSAFPYYGITDAHLTRYVYYAVLRQSVNYTEPQSLYYQSNDFHTMARHHRLSRSIIQSIPISIFGAYDNAYVVASVTR